MSRPVHSTHTDAPGSPDQPLHLRAPSGPHSLKPSVKVPSPPSLLHLRPTPVPPLRTFRLSSSPPQSDVCRPTCPESAQQVLMHVVMCYTRGTGQRMKYSHTRFCHLDVMTLYHPRRPPKFSLDEWTPSPSLFAISMSPCIIIIYFVFFLKWLTYFNFILKEKCVYFS